MIILFVYIDLIYKCKIATFSQFLTLPLLLFVLFFLGGGSYPILLSSAQLALHSGRTSGARSGASIEPKSGDQKANTLLSLLSLLLYYLIYLILLLF